MDEDNYGDIADEDLIEAFSQASQTLPPRPAKRRRISEGVDNDDGTRGSRRRSYSVENGSGVDEETGKSKKKSKYRIHVADQEVPAARIIGATQAEAHPDSSPYRIRGPIYKKPRPEPPPPTPPRFTAPLRRSGSIVESFKRQASKPSQDNDFAHELEDLPSDAFSSPEYGSRPKEPIEIGSSPPRVTQESSRTRRQLVAPQQGLKQTTLFGDRVREELSASQTKKVHNFIVDLPPEAPTHHALNEEALRTWVYPTNLGTIRDYQYSIVKHGLFNNLLVALPTGLGKTFIAATIMLNFFRWTKDAKIVFVAPTKPLVAQQVDACFNIVGIPKSQTTMLTGEQVPILRAEEWLAKRVFFMTPQTLDNDLASGIADPKNIVLLVVDEAHRATGNYSYVKVVNFMRRFNKSFRILALTATPGASVEAVQEVIDGLEISKVEIRTEESIDIQQYVHRRNIEQILLDPSDEMVMVKDLLAKALQPIVNQLCGQNAYYNRDPMALTPFAMMQARKKWFSSDAARKASQGLKGMMHGLFSILASVAHSIKLLNFHGIGPFYSSIKDFKQGVDDKNKPSKYKSQIVDSPDFKKMMDRIQLWISKDDFVGHPKLTYLCENVLNHFMDAGEGRLGEDAPPSATRVIVFAEYRDSAEDIARVLNRHGPMIRASVFVGQADSKRSEGMNQQKQQDAIKKFKNGVFNVIVATSIGEEGLDIGQVDLIVCYDASASPIRMLQRMGRTGRKRAGNIVLLLMKGKEEENFTKAKDNYEQMQKMISSGSRFNFRHDLSVRILPRDIVPVVEKRMIEIPIENTQDPSLPEPKRRPTKGLKKPPKKFHIPDGVQTGFQKASKLSMDGTILTDLGVTVKCGELDKKQLAPIPELESVLLSPEQEDELRQKYQIIPGSNSLEVEMPDMAVQTVAQRSLGPISNVAHGKYTRRCVKLFKTLADSQDIIDRFTMPYGETEPEPAVWGVPNLVEDERDVRQTPGRPKKTPSPKPKQSRKRAPNQAIVLSDIESDDDESDATPKGRQQRRKRVDSSPAADSEGAGDDLMNSEDPSEDSDVSIGSMKDFLADGFSSSMRDHPLTRSSSTSPELDPGLKTFQKPLLLPATQETNDDDEDEDDDLPELPELGGILTKQHTQVQSDEPEEDVRPVSRHRENRRRVIRSSDSDE
ncbi:P-loop containing nucleoside triphosphate hydrolase protein [Stipitochalara longipes BDJ]|nr:P-loop containing nucleoside triphosphate hydrolase protein [Stipitochalara longipes BDJ]